MGYIDGCIERSKECGMYEGRVPRTPESAGSVSKYWKIKRYIIEEYTEDAPDRKTALEQCHRNGGPTVYVTKETCVALK